MTPAGASGWYGQVHLAGTIIPARRLSIRFPDGSYILFRYALAIVDEPSREVAVFTEHCRYHVFPLGDAEVEVLRASALGPDA